MFNEDLKKNATMELVNLIDQDRLRCWFLSIFHKSGIVCCHCGKPLSELATKSFLEYRITSCVHCRKKVHFFRNTPFSSAKIPPEKFIVLAFLLDLDVPVAKIAEVLHLSDASVRDWKRKLSVPGMPLLGEKVSQ